MVRITHWSWLWGIVFLVGPVVVQAEKETPTTEPDYSAELPHFPAVEPADAVKTLELKSDVQIELVAAEPLIASPVAVAWDENCQLYVCEMRGYSECRDEALSRIRLLRDDNGDGRYDQATVFVDGLLWPTAIACWNGGLFVGDAPHIYYFKDHDGDGRADHREIVYTGFTSGNVQGLINTFLWTFDNRIHGAGSSLGGEITRPDAPSFKSASIRGRDFDFDPRTRDLRPTSGGAQHGMSFDDWGHKFVSSNSDHIQQVMFEDRYMLRNPYLNSPSARVSIAADGPQAEVFRSSPIEPWRVVRTRLRASGAVRGPVEGGGRPGGYFTGATGVTIYRGHLLPDDCVGVAVVADVGSNLVHRKRLKLAGVQFLAERIDQRSEWLASTDTWFRPVQFANGPDGALYVVDMYREIIEHPAALPEAIKKHFDTSSGRDRGRLYRIVPPGYQSARLPKLGALGAAELVALLGHPNAWHRETASRLIYERQDPMAGDALLRLAQNSSNPLGRIHAIYALAGLKLLTAEATLRALKDSHPRVRQHAVRLAEQFLPGDDSLVQQLVAMTSDNDLQVRYQLAFTAGYLPVQQRQNTIVELARRDSGNSWVRVAMQSSLADDAAAVVCALIEDSEARAAPEAAPFLVALAQQVSRRNQVTEVSSLLTVLKRFAEADRGLTMAIAKGMLETKGSQARKQLLDPESGWTELRMSISTAIKTALDIQEPTPRRIEAIGWLAMTDVTSATSAARQLLDSRQPSEVQLATVTALGEFTHPQVAVPVIEQWSSLSPSVKSAALDMLLARSTRVQVLLDAIESGTFPVAEIDMSRASRLLAANDPQRRPKARQLLGVNKVARRQDVVDAYQPALKLTGSVERGKQIFHKVCATCHRAENVGFEIGPSLSTMKNRGPEAILLNVLDPSREVNPQFVNYTCVTNDGRSLTGMLAAETATSITLRRAENQQDTVLRIDIDELQSTGASIMPEGLEKQIDRQSMADVIAYIMQLP